MKKWLRIGILVLICGGIFGLIIFNMTYRPPVSTEVWDMATVIGDPETATRHYIQYSDFACPYCDIFTHATLDHEEEFNNFLAEHHILYEIRLTEVIYDSTGSDMSVNSAVAAYCAKRENRFIDYYRAGVQALWDDYHSKGIGDSKTSPRITGMPDDYWQKIGDKLGLGESFDNCVKNQETLSEVREVTDRAEKYVNGLPFFQFGSQTFSGLASSSWNWDYTLEYLKAGL